MLEVAVVVEVLVVEEVELVGAAFKELITVLLGLARSTAALLTRTTLGVPRVPGGGEKDEQERETWRVRDGPERGDTMSTGCLEV